MKPQDWVGSISFHGAETKWNNKDFDIIIDCGDGNYGKYIIRHLPAYDLFLASKDRNDARAFSAEMIMTLTEYYIVIKKDINGYLSELERLGFSISINDRNNLVDNFKIDKKGKVFEFANLQSRDKFPVEWQRDGNFIKDSAMSNLLAYCTLILPKVPGVKLLHKRNAFHVFEGPSKRPVVVSAVPAVVPSLLINQYSRLLGIEPR